MVVVVTKTCQTCRAALSKREGGSGQHAGCHCLLKKSRCMDLPGPKLCAGENSSVQLSVRFLCAVGKRHQAAPSAPTGVAPYTRTCDFPPKTPPSNSPTPTPHRTFSFNPSNSGFAGRDI